MPKPEWGVKRACPSCGVRFYDLTRSPITCPECAAPFETVTKDRTASLKADLARAQSAEAGRADELIDEGDAAGDADGDTDDGLLDAEDEKEGDTSPALSDEEGSDEPVKFADDVLLDDEDEDPIKEIGDVAAKDDSET